jgi:hypothetical protein
MRRVFAFCLVAISLFNASTPIPAAELRLVNDNTLLYLIGKIEPGDGTRVREAVRAAGPTLETLMLRSVGGSMYDSMSRALFAGTATAKRSPSL